MAGKTVVALDYGSSATVRRGFEPDLSFHMTKQDLNLNADHGAEVWRRYAEIARILQSSPDQIGNRDLVNMRITWK